MKYGRATTCSLRNNRQLQDRDYVTHLEKRIKCLRRALAGGIAPGGEPSPLQQRAREEDRPHVARSIDQLISEIGTLPILISNESASGPSLGDVALFAAGFFEFPKARFSIDDMTSRFLPEKSLAQKLINHHLSSIYPRIPFFSIEGMWNQFELAYSSNQADLATIISPPAQEYPATPYPVRTNFQQYTSTVTAMDRGYALFTVLMVLSISTASLSRSLDSLASHNGEKLFCLALQFREFALIPNTIIGVQSMLFLIQYATLNPSRLDGWYLIGVGMRLCLDLGLQHDPDLSDAGQDHSLLETRRRLFWSMYSFDRSISLGLGRPVELVDDAISASLPEFRIGSNFSEDDIIIYRQRYTILHLQSLAYERLWCPTNDVTPADVEEFSTLFDQWHAQNPPAVVASNRARELLESEWLQARMLIYRPCKSLMQRSSDDLLKLWEASLAFIHIYKLLTRSNGIFYIQVACEKVYAAGLNILYAFWHISHLHSDPNLTMIADLWSGVADVNVMMETLSNRWEEGERLARNFENLSEKVLRATRNGHHETPSSNGSITGHSNPMLSVSEVGWSELFNMALPAELSELWKHSSPISASTKENALIDERQDMQALLRSLDTP
jgi:hypothetical protein